MAKYRIKGLPKNILQKGGANSKKDKWGRSSDNKWYGFDPNTKKWTLGMPTWKTTPTKSKITKEYVDQNPDFASNVLNMPEVKLEPRTISKDKWGRKRGDKWFGFDPKTKKWTLGESDWHKSLDEYGREEGDKWYGQNPWTQGILEGVGAGLNAADEFFSGSQEERSKEAAREYQQKLYRIYKNTPKELRDQRFDVVTDENGKKHLQLTPESLSGPHNNYNDGPIQPVYPEELFMGPAGVGKSALQGLGKSSFNALNKINRFGASNLVPKYFTKTMTLGEKAALKERLSPFTVGNILTAESVSRIPTEYVPEIMEGKDVTSNILESIASMIPLTKYNQLTKVQNARNVYNTGKYGSKLWGNPDDVKDQYKFYRALGALTGHRDGGPIPKAQLGIQNNPLNTVSNNLLIKAANNKKPKSLAKDVRPTPKQQDAINRQKQAEADYIKAVATGKSWEVAKAQNQELVAAAQEQQRLQDELDQKLVEREQKKFRAKPNRYWDKFGLGALDLFDTETQVGQMTRDFLADPLNVAEEGIWDQDYLPNRSAILRDPSHPLYQYYTRRTGMDASPLSQGLQYINPFSSAAEATVAIRNKDYTGALKQYGEGLLKTAGLVAAAETLPAAMAAPVALPTGVAAATGITGATTVGGVLGAGFAGWGLSKLPQTADKIAKAINTGTKEDWREAVNETGLNLLDFVGTGEFLESSKAFTGIEGKAALLAEENRIFKNDLYNLIEQNPQEAFTKLVERVRTQNLKLSAEELQNISSRLNTSFLQNPDRYEGLYNLKNDLLADEFKVYPENDLNKISEELKYLDNQLKDLERNASFYDPDEFDSIYSNLLQDREYWASQYDNAFVEDDFSNALTNNVTSGNTIGDSNWAEMFRGEDDQLNFLVDRHSTIEEEISMLKDSIFQTKSLGIEGKALDDLEQALDAKLMYLEDIRNSVLERALEVRMGNAQAVQSSPASNAFTWSSSSNAPVDYSAELNSAFANSHGDFTPPTGAVEPYSFDQRTLDAMASGSNLRGVMARINHSGDPVQSLRRLFAAAHRNTINDMNVFKDLLSANSHYTKALGRSPEYISAYENIESKMMSAAKSHNSFDSIGYTGSNRSFKDIDNWYKNISDRELDMLDMGYSYNSNDIAELYQELGTSNARRALLNQVYDDYRFLVNHELNPNINRSFEISNRQVLNESFKPSGFENYTDVINPEEMNFLTEYTASGSKNFSGYQNYNTSSILEEPKKLLNSSLIQKTEDLEPLIEKYQKIYDSLPDGTPKTKVLFLIEDLKSTKWLRTEYADELKAMGLKPSEIEEASIISYYGDNPSMGRAAKQLVNKDGEVVGSLLLNDANVTMPDGSTLKGMTIGHSGVNFKFHPYTMGKTHSKFSSLTEAKNYLLKEKLSPELKDISGQISRATSKEELLELEEMLYEKRLNTFPEDVRNKSYVKTRAKEEVSGVISDIKKIKKEVDDQVALFEKNNNNRWGDALYVGVHHGIKDVRGPVLTYENFVDTSLPDKITGEIITRPRAKDYWYSKKRQKNAQGVSRAEHIYDPNAVPSGIRNYLKINWKHGGNTPKLKMFTS